MCFFCAKFLYLGSTLQISYLELNSCFLIDMYPHLESERGKYYIAAFTVDSVVHWTLSLGIFVFKQWISCLPEEWVLFLQDVKIFLMLREQLVFEKVAHEYCAPGLFYFGVLEYINSFNWYTFLKLWYSYNFSLYFMSSLPNNL